MRKMIILGAVAALLGLVTTAQASNHAERAVKNGGRITYTDSDDRGEKAEHRTGARAEYQVRDRDDDAYEHGKDAREREHRERNGRD